MSVKLSSYRAIVREVNKASVSPRSAGKKVICSNFRALFEAPRTGDDQKQFEYDIQSALTFMQSKRMHKTLIDRYNPLHDLDPQERIKATARRVGLDMPVTKGDSDH